MTSMNFQHPLNPKVRSTPCAGLFRCAVPMPAEEILQHHSTVDLWCA